MLQGGNSSRLAPTWSASAWTCRAWRRRDSFTRKTPDRRCGRKAGGMALNIQIAAIAGDPAIVARAESVRADVAAASADIEHTRRLPAALLDKLHDAGLFRLLMP